jgi:hypothetical protein
VIEMDSWQADTVTVKRMTYQQALSWVEHEAGVELTDQNRDR